MFPGNQLLLSTPGMLVAATPGAQAAVVSEVLGQEHWMEKAPEYVERHISFYYGNDPTVMKLLDLYLEAEANRKISAGETFVDKDLEEIEKDLGVHPYKLEEYELWNQ